MRKKSPCKIYSICSLFVIMLVSLHTVAQHNIKFRPENFRGNQQGFRFAIEKLQEGNQYIANAEYQMALPFYLSADSINPDNADLNTKIGVCYLNSYCKARCLPYFRKAYSLDKRISSRIHFFLGRSYQLNCQWDSAIAEYEIALKKASKKEKKKDDFGKYIQECNSGRDLAAHPVKTRIVNLGASINSPYKDFRPYVVANGSELFFTSQRPDSNGVEQDPSTGEYVQGIYMAKYKDGKWGNADVMSPPVNGQDNNQTAYVTPDGTNIFIYRDVNGGDIYSSTLSGHTWQECLQLSDTVNTIHRETSVCLSPSGNTIFFVSNRPGGKGGQDIYVAHKVSEGSWTKPVNLGDSLINTPYDEDGVFMNPDGKTLYFSSKGHNSMGGYDIFVTQYDSATDECTPPKNLGYPINTPDDDVYFSTSDNGRYGYYGSFRDSLNSIGGYDIYRVSMDAFMPKELVLEGTIEDSISQKPVKTTITITDKASSKTTTMNLDTITGRYYLTLPAGHQFDVKVSANGYADYVYAAVLPDTMMFREEERNILLKKAMVITLVHNARRDSCTPKMAILMRRFSGLTSDTNIVLTALQYMDTNLCLKEMKFTVQIGAYQKERNFKYKKFGLKKKEVNTFTEYFKSGALTNVKKKSKVDSTVTCFTSGSFDTYEEAKAYKMKMIEMGLKDSFVIGMYNDKPVNLKNLLHHQLYDVKGTTGNGQKTEE